MSKIITVLGFVCLAFWGCGDEDGDGTNEAACTELADLAQNSIVQICAGRTDCLLCTCAYQKQVLNEAHDACEPRLDADGCSAQENSEARQCLNDKDCKATAQGGGIL